MDKEVVEADLLELDEGIQGNAAAWRAVLSVVEEICAELRSWQQRSNFEGVEFLEWSLIARDRLRSVWDLVDCGDWRVEMEVEARRGSWVGGDAPPHLSA